MFFPWHQKPLNQLLDQLIQDHFSHAYLVTGSEGLGQYEFANTLAHHVLCEQQTACGQCHSCILLKAGNHPDLKICQVDTGQTIKIAQVRELVDYAVQTPQIARKQMIIIPDAHKMTKACANALLKTLEEPTPSTGLLLTSSKSHLLLPTIRSRCQSIVLRIRQEELHDWLVQQGHSEHEISNLPLSYTVSPLKAHQFLSDDMKSQYHLFLEHIRYSNTETLVKFLSEQASPALILCWWQEFVAKIYKYSSFALDEKIWSFYQTLVNMLALLDRQVAYNKPLMWHKLCLLWTQHYQSSAQHCFE